MIKISRMHSLIWFLTVFQLACLTTLDIANGHVYFIKSTENYPCPDNPCLTLSQFAANAASFVNFGETNLFFLPGTHILNSVLKLVNADKFSMKPLFISSVSEITIISCGKQGGFEFQDSTEIKLNNLHFVGCSNSNVSSVRQFIIENSSFVGNVNDDAIPLFYATRGSRVYIAWSNFTRVKGGALVIYRSLAEISHCRFTNNEGGAVVAWRAEAVIKQCLFYNNSMKGQSVGTSVYGMSSKLIIHESNFSCNVNKEKYSGAIYVVEYTELSVYGCLFHKNSAALMAGAVFVMHRSVAYLRNTIFSENLARSGGALTVCKSTTFIENSFFKNNTAETGSAIYAYSDAYLKVSNTTIVDNKANCAGMFIIGSTCIFSDHSVYSRNIGSLFAFNARINISDSLFTDNDYALNKPINATEVDIDEGGAITAFQSEIMIDGSCKFDKNRAKVGGAVCAIESKVHVLGELAVSNNLAKESGGGFYLTQSELTCELESRLNLISNTANKTGGGIHSISSFISLDYMMHPWGTTTLHYEYLGTLVLVRENKASKGGGIYLEREAKIYILKKDKHSDPQKQTYVLSFRFNSADYGGAMYVSDESNLDTCSSTSYEVHSASTECFLQTLALHGRRSTKINLVSTTFEHNIATISGSSLFGGLLDRCTTSSFAEVYYKIYEDPQPATFSGLSYLEKTTNIQDGLESISSFPVRLCYCRDQQPDCLYQPPPVKVMKGENLTVFLTAVDQLNETISNVLIHNYLSSYEGTLGTNQIIQSTKNGCTELNFTVLSLQSMDELIMYPQGPCGNVEMSQLKQEIEFLPCSCSIGFEQNVMEKTKCDCTCDSRLSPYITECNAENGIVIRKGDFWIDYVNDSSGFVVYSHCPRDYCQPSSLSVSINLNIPNGSDAQCTHSRSGVLCGSCKPGLSLSLDGKNCVTCKQNWPLKFTVILVAAILAGILLVAFILMFNLTVAVGTLNGIFFYANIVNINKDLLFPFPKPNYVTVFISWLNLDIGFDTCFFEGMDAYSKTWLQVVFPVYLIFLVVIIIILGECSQRFANLIGKRDPVATLATLILLSYDQLFQMAIQVFSFAVLDYPDGSQEVVWLLDGNIKYFRGKHIPLFITAFFILCACILYTVLLFSWQWLLRCPNKKCFGWIRNQKLHLFLKSYHTPYSIKHRYWTGLLLVARILLSISSAVNMSNDPGVNILPSQIIMIFLIVLAERSSPVYENSVIEFIEITIYANMTFFFAFSLYFIGVGKNQIIAAYISGTVAIIQLIFILLHRLYVALIPKNRLSVKIKKAFSRGGGNELINFPPLDENAMNEPECDDTFPSLDYQREIHPTFIVNNEVRENICTAEIHPTY